MKRTQVGGVGYWSAFVHPGAGQYHQEPYDYSGHGFLRDPVRRANKTYYRIPIGEGLNPRLIQRPTSASFESQRRCCEPLSH